MKELISILTILVKYGNPIIPFYYADGVLSIIGIPPENVSIEDKKELKRLGVFADTINDTSYFRTTRFIL